VNWKKVLGKIIKVAK
uniref:Lasioglossin-1 n=1 Tax=Lasioglossum laticeps TaxID=88510 RepID=LL1_LASLA|nr:RecName: Full=Lasioglossin-1; Short=LL-I [Lasioglossum laticeps]